MYQDVQSAWGMPLQVSYCAQCHSAHLTPADVSLAVCPACLRPGLTAQPEQMRREPPELMIPFAVGEQRAAAMLDQWAKGIWFRPSDLRADLLRQRMRRYFFPLWLVDVHVQASWQAEMGFDYQAASFREKFAGGQWVSEQITETRARWEPRLGTLDRRYENVAVPAMETHQQWMTRLGGYDFRTRQDYSPRAIVQSVVRVPDHAPDAAWMDAETAIGHVAQQECQTAAAADHARNWSMRAEYRDLNWTQMLTPAYITFYQEGDQTCPIWINGQSGQIYGVKLLSMQKALIVSLIIGVLAVLCFLLGLILTLIGIGILLILLSLLIGLAAPVPAAWVWIHNRQAARTG